MNKQPQKTSKKLNSGTNEWSEVSIPEVSGKSDDMMVNQMRTSKGSMDIMMFQN